ncbi:MAG: RNA--NAD 2'-phosphotransferase [Candidatus Latescibacteria bacterium]|nr:RNA--NAD 2'-phosphotransferase [bacterium]MBD3425288.1 RNA--NAD 2'-phosphotransferase [Candidatus Latescibacterota bacterium]
MYGEKTCQVYRSRNSYSAGEAAVPDAENKDYVAHRHGIVWGCGRIFLPGFKAAEGKEIVHIEKFVRKSRFLSWALRHDPEQIGLSLDRGGWADISELIRCASARGIRLDRQIICEIVSTDSKGRYQLSGDRGRIRALYGHSKPVELDLKRKEPPQVLYHGTATRNVDSIMKKGLLPVKRQYVHLSSGRSSALEVGRRHGRVILLEVDSGSMNREGIDFYNPTNQIWLVRGVPPGYITLC